MTEVKETLDPNKEVPLDEFLNNLKKVTHQDTSTEPKPEGPKDSDASGPGSAATTSSSSNSKKDDNDDEDDDLNDLSNPGLVSDMIIEIFDLAHNMAMQAISKTPDGDLFKAPEKGKKRIKRVTTKLIERMNFNLRPEFLLVLLVIIVYAPSTMKAINIKKQKARAKKEAAGEKEPEITIKRPAHRPPGSKNKPKT